MWASTGIHRSWAAEGCRGGFFLGALVVDILFKAVPKDFGVALKTTDLPENNDRG